MYKELFPFFKTNPDSVYLDSAASSLKLESVITSISDYYKNYSCNIERGTYSQSLNATAVCENTRRKISKYFNCSSDEIIFTRGCSDSLNMIGSMLGETLKEGDEVITSELEHHSSFLPWLNGSKKYGFTLKFVPLKENKITVEGFKSVLSENTKVVCLTHVSNALGYITPIKEIIEEAHKVGAIVVVDGAQAVPHMRVDFASLDCDAYCFSFHKMYGPTGLGVLYIKKDLQSKLSPRDLGGEMMDEVTYDNVTFKKGSHKFETGTMPIAEIFGAGAAIDFAIENDFNLLEIEAIKIRNYALDELKKLPEIEIYNDDFDSSIITFNIKGVHSHDSITYYSEHNICMRAGHHCAQILHENRLCVSSTLRASFAFYNTIEDAKRFVDVTKDCIKMFKEVGYIG